MRVKLKCPNPECGKALTLDTDWAGKKGTCSNCEKSFKIPANIAQLATQHGSSDQTMHGALAQSHSSSGEGLSQTEGLSSVRKEQLSSPKDESDDSVVDAISEPLETPRQPAKKKAAGPVRRKKTASKKAAPPPRKKAAKKKSRPARVDDDLDFVDDELDFVDDEPEEDYEDYDEAPRRRAGGGGRRRPNRGGGGGRSRQDDYDDYDDPDDEYDDYDDGYDDYDDRPRRGGGGGGGRSGGRRRGVALAQIAVLIVAIALCVRGGGHLLVVFSKLLVELQSSSFSSGASAVFTMTKVALWLTFLADLAMLGGYIVAIIAPSKGAAKAIAITCVSLCGVSTGLMFFLQVLPSMEAGGGSRTLMSLFGFQVLSGGSPFVAVMKNFLLTVIFVAHMPIFAHYLKQATRDSAAMVPFFIAMGWVGVQLFKAIILLIMSKSMSTGMIYFYNTVHWIGLVCLTVYFVLAIISAFKLRRKV